ncbi:hypothetical protein JCM8097_008882 [Rhodosporidiobolus ruineniae]
MRFASLSPAAIVGAASLYAFSSVSASPVLARASSAPSATIKNGTVVGVELPTFAQEAFLGIPFAQPPMGDLRLRRARSLNTTFEGGVFEATEYSPFCPGVGGDNIGFKMSEDCLTVNVVRPAGVKEGDNLPVGAWIYGGGFQMGGNADQRYNTTYMIQRAVELEKPIISVHINYRTAALGFLNSKEVKAEGSQNLGLYDQRLALHWIQENIAAFGGDPSKVTIWGESAGAISVAYQLLGYGLSETDLFSGAILESGNAHTIQFLSVEQSQKQFDAVLNGTGCAGADDALGCLRGLSLEEFNNTASAYSFNPVVDGEIIPAYAGDTLASGSFVSVPMLIGTNTDEGSAFGAKGINTTADLAAALYASYPAMTNSSVDALLELYPNDPLEGCPFNTGDTVLTTGLQDKRSNAIYGDLRFQAGRREFAELISKKAPVYSYRFNQPAENATIETGTTHFVEVAYVFGYPYKTANTLGTRPGDSELSHLLQSQWISFIHDGTPNNHGIADIPNWPSYADSPSNFVFSRHGQSVETDDYRKEAFEYFKTLDWQLNLK